MLYDDEQIRKRILKFMHQEKLTQLEFAKKIGKTQPAVSEILRARRGITKAFIDSILNAFSNVDKDWLLYGAKDQDDLQEYTEDFSPNTRPRLPITFADGNIEAFLDKHRSACQEKKVVSQFADYEFTIILKNDRMSPKYQRGDELAFRKSSIVEWGNDYLLDTDEGPKFKRVFLEEDEKGNKIVRCESYNKENYPDFTIPYDKIYEFYKCVGVIRVL